MEHKIKIAFFDAKEYDINSFNEVNKKYPNIEIKYLYVRLNEDTINLAQGYDAVCVFVNDELNKNVIRKLNDFGIKAIFLRCAGYNNVDLKETFGKIHIYRVPAYSPYAVAEFAFAMLQTSNRRLHKAYNRVKEYNFSLVGLVGNDLHDKTVGVIGTGKIGRCFINIALGYGMKVLAYDKYPNPLYKDIQYVSLDTLFKESDIISLHCPLTEESFHMINKESIKAMKKGVIIINTSRGALIDAEALLEGIKERIIGSACLDVYEEESDIFYQDKSNHIMNDNILLQLIAMPNVIITSHQAYLTKEALDNIAETTMNNIGNFFDDKPMISNEVCYQCANIDNCKKERNNKCF